MLSFSFFHTSFIGFILLVHCGIFWFLYIAIQEFYLRATGKLVAIVALPVPPFPLAMLIIIVTFPFC
jgi:hypothetical protein